MPLDHLMGVATTGESKSQATVKTALDEFSGELTASVWRVFSQCRPSRGPKVGGFSGGGVPFRVFTVA